MRNGYFEFLAHFVDLTDPREDRGYNHKLLDVIGLALCGTICGANSWADVERFAKAHIEWFEQFLELPYGVPSHDTFSRLFARLDTEEFQKCLGEWVQQLQLQLEGKTVSIDGKTLCGSHDRPAAKQALHIVSAWANQVKFCLGQVSVESKSNEIPAVRELLDILNLKGAVVTADAMHCQKETAQKIIDKEANYVLQVKQNQKSLSAAITEEIDRYAQDNFQHRKVRQLTTTEKNRGRLETRTVMVAPAPAALKKKWPGLQTIGVIHRRREMPDGTESEELTSFISSLPPKVRDLAKHVRNHWSIENTLHHTLDVTFTEDGSRIRKGNGPEIIAALRRFSLSILKSDRTIKDNVRGKRLLAGWNLNNLEGILLGFQAI